MIPQLTTDTPHAKSTHTPNAHNNQKTAVQVISHTLRQHLTTRQTQPPTTHTIPKLALDYRNHRLHLPTLTIQATRLRAFHQLGTHHARPRPQPTPASYRRYHIRPLYIPTIKPCVRQQPKSCRTPLAYHIPTRLGTQRGWSRTPYAIAPLGDCPCCEPLPLDTLRALHSCEGLIPIARAEFTIAPLLKVPPASRGEPRGARGFGSPCLQGEP